MQFCSTQWVNYTDQLVQSGIMFGLLWFPYQEIVLPVSALWYQLDILLAFTKNVLFLTWPAEIDLISVDHKLLSMCDIIPAVEPNKYKIKVAYESTLFQRMNNLMHFPCFGLIRKLVLGHNTFLIWTCLRYDMYLLNLRSLFPWQMVVFWHSIQCHGLIVLYISNCIV